MRYQTGILALLTIFATVSMPFPLNFSAPLKVPAVQANTSDARKAEAERLRQQGIKQFQAGEYQAAIQSLQQALPIYRELSDVEGEDDVWFRLVRAYKRLGDSKKANEYQQQRITLAHDNDNGGDSLKELSLIRELGDNHYCTGDISAAISSYQQSLAIAKEVNNKKEEEEILIKEEEAEILIRMGKSLVKQGNFTEAEKTLRESIQVWEYVRSIALSRTESEFDKNVDRANREVFESESEVYFPLQQALIGQNKTDAALEIAEQGRARAFAELLAKRQEAANNPTVQSTINPITLEQIKQIAKEHKATLVEYSIIYNDASICLTKVQTLELLTWVIKPTGEVVFRRSNIDSVLQQKNSSLADLVIGSREAIGVKGRGLTVQASVVENKPANQLKKLHQLLIQPIADQLSKEPESRVIFIPQDLLFFVPFPALQDESEKYLIEEHTILTAPSIQILQLTQQAKQRISGVAKNILVIGNPTMPSISTSIQQKPEQLPSLPGAETEAKAVAALLNTQALIGSQATKAAVMQQMSQARLIHFATHGLLDAVETRSNIPGAIALAKSGNSDPAIHIQFDNYREAYFTDNGLLSSSEIMDFRLSAEMVVLSACDTGRGEITGDGVVGLSRAFISAGVPSVIVSLWSISDLSTEFFMTEFYRNFQQNPDKAQALRKAMLATKKKYPAPIYWAAFTLIGEAE